MRPISILFPFLAEPAPDSEVVISETERAVSLGFSGHNLVYPDKNDWSPKLGLALSPTGNNRVVLRAGYRLHHSPLSSTRARDYIGRNYLFFQREMALSSQERPEIDISDPFASRAPTELAFRGIDPGIRTAYAQDWRLVIQKQFSRNWNLEASYQGSKGTRLDRIIPGNVAFPRARSDSGQTTRSDLWPVHGSEWAELPASSMVLVSTSSESWSTGFLSAPDSTGADPSPTAFFFNVSNPRDLAAERAVSSRRPLRRGYLNYIFDLPVNFKAGLFGSLISGWRLSGITQFRDGEPFTVSLPGDFNNDGVPGDRPIRIGDGNLPVDQRSVDQWFDTSAFTEPGEFQFGDSGRSILTGPGLQTWDIALSKTTEISDGHPGRVPG